MSIILFFCNEKANRRAGFLRVRLSALCTPGMGVNLWGASPLYVNPVNVLNTLTKVLADGKGKTARCCLKEARVQSYEPSLS